MTPTEIAKVKLHEARKALACLYIVVEQEVAIDVQRRVEAAFTALQALAAPASQEESHHGKCQAELHEEIPCTCPPGWPRKQKSKPQPPVGGEGVRAHDPHISSRSETLERDGEDASGRVLASRPGLVSSLAQCEVSSQGEPGITTTGRGRDEATQGSGLGMVVKPDPEGVGDRRPLAPPELEALYTLWLDARESADWSEDYSANVDAALRWVAAGEARAAALQADMVALAKLATQREVERDKWLNAFNQSEQFQSGPTKRAEVAEAALEERNAQLAKMQTHRDDYWRGYAYAVRAKPRDFLDGDMVNRPPTFLEINAQLLDERTKQLAAAEAAIVSLQAELDRYKKPAGIVESWQNEAETNRQAFVKAQTHLSDLQAQLQAITQEMRAYTKSWATPQIDQWADRLAVLGKEQP